MLAPGILRFLVHANRVVTFVVVNDRDNRRAILLRRRHLLTRHEKTTVADVGDDRAVGVRELGGDRRWDTRSHTAESRRDVGVGMIELDIALLPLAEAAGVCR